MRRREEWLESLGLTLLSIEASWAEWAAWNPSYFTVDKFAAREGTEEDIRSVRTGMVGGLVTIYGTAIAFPLVFKKKGLVPAAAHALIGTMMFAIYASRIGWDRLLAPTASAGLQNNVNSRKSAEVYFN